MIHFGTEDRAKNLLPLLVAAGVAFWGNPCLAQPPDQASGIETRDAVQVAREWAAFRAANLAEETTDPHGAIAHYQKFYEERGRRSGAASVAITSLIAQIYRQNLKDRDKALKIYEWGIQQFAWHPDSARLKRELELMQSEEKAEIAPLQIPKVETSVPAGVPVVPQALVPQALVPQALVPQALVPQALVPQALVPPVIQMDKPVLPSALYQHNTPQLAGTIKSLTLVHVTFLAQLLAHPESADILWNDSGLSVSDLPALLASQMADDRTKEGQSVRLALAGLLERHKDKEKESAQPILVRRAVADYYASIRDERAIALYEGLLAEAGKQGPQKRDVTEVDKLAAFYQTTNQPAKAAEVLARTDKYTTVPSLVGNGWVEAARLYRQAGDEKRASALYQKVMATPSEWGWAKGLALYDPAKLLIRQGKHEDARKLLTTPISGLYSDQMEVALLSLLGYSYYRTGEWDKAREFSQAAIAQEQKVGKLLANEGLEQHVTMAKRTLEYIEQWPKTPLVAEPALLSAKVPATDKPGHSFRLNFGVQSLRRVPIQVTSDNPAVRVRVAPPERAADKGHLFQTMVVLEISPEAVGTDLNATLTVQSPAHPGVVLTVPVHVQGS